MVYGILSAEEELILKAVWQQPLNGVSVCLRRSGRSKINSADISLQGAGCLVISDFAADNIDCTVFLYELWEQITLSICSYEVQPFNTRSLEAVGKDIRIIVEFVYGNLTVI